MRGTTAPFRGLYEDPVEDFEGHLERLTGAAAGEGLERDIAPDAGADVAAPGDRRLGVGEGGIARVQEDRLAVRGDGEPVPWRTTLKRPPESLPAPSTLWMSQSMPGSIARTLSPLTVIRSFSRSRIMILRLSCARNRSPVPAAVISLTPSPVMAFLKKRPSPPLWYSKRT